MPPNNMRPGCTLNLGPLFTPTVAVKDSLRLGSSVSAHTVRGLLMLLAATGASFVAVEDAHGNGVLCFFHGSSFCRASVADCGPLKTGYEENSSSCPVPPPTASTAGHAKPSAGARHFKSSPRSLPTPRTSSLFNNLQGVALHS